MFDEQYSSGPALPVPIPETEAPNPEEHRPKPASDGTEPDEKPDLGPADDGLKFDGIWEMELGVGD